MIDKIKNLILIIFILILYYLMSYSNNLNYQNEYFTNFKPTISLCIPCYPPDTRELDKLMESVRKLTVKPEQIIVGHSEMTQIDAKKLEEKFNPYQLNVIDESHLHEGHVGAKPEGETHFKVEMKSNKFLGMSRVNMQKEVYKTLELEMKNKIHALSLKLSS